MATLAGTGVKAAREEKGVSQRQLARRVADRLGDPERATALGVLFSRVERRESSDLDDELARTLAEELAVGIGDLEEGALYTWVRTEGHRRVFPALGLRQLVWTSPAAAFDARDIIAVEARGFPKFDLDIARGSTLVPVLREAIRRTMEGHAGDLHEHELTRLFVVDPSEQAIKELIVAQVALTAEDAESRQGAAHAWAQRAAEGGLETAGPDELFNFLERRKSRARTEGPTLGEIPPEVLAAWEREHAALADAALAYLNFRYEHLRARREASEPRRPRGGDASDASH